MTVKIITFNADGDLLLLLAYPPEEEKAKAIEVATDTGTGKGNSDIPTPANDATVLPTTQPKKEVHMLVIAKILMCASPVFKAMLQRGNFKEGQELLAGKVDVPLLDDDPAALEILMNILHFNTSSVPRRVDYKILINVAILVDKYQMLEAVKAYVDHWVPGIRAAMPKLMTDKLIPWICVAWVFRLPDEFKLLTRIAVLESDGTEGNVELPLPGRILATIEKRRQVKIASIVSIVQKTIDKYLQPKLVCNGIFHDDTNRQYQREICDSAILGSILRSAKANGLWPLPEAPYLGISLKSIISKAGSLKLMGMFESHFLGWEENRKIRRLGGQKADDCNYLIKKHVDEIERRATGLSIEDFTAST